MNLPAHDALASIIIPCWNQLEYTRFCLPALVRHTRPPWELIVIDNGSTDGTGIYLAGVQDVAPVPVTVVSNAQNMGFPAAVNQGLKVARGDYLVLLNNDAVVTDGWLSQLIALAEMDSELTTKHTKDTKGGNGRGQREDENWHGRADVELCLAAATGGERAVWQPGRDARVRAAMARGASGAVVHGE